MREGHGGPLPACSMESVEAVRHGPQQNREVPPEPPLLNQANLYLATLKTPPRAVDLPNPPAPPQETTADRGNP